MRWRRSSGDRCHKPNPMLPSTVSQGNTPRSWNTKIRRGSGPVTASPSMRTSPLVGVMKPAITFRMVDLPHPEGPSRHTNSPSRTSRLMSSSTLMRAPSLSNAMQIRSARSLAFGARAIDAGAVAGGLIIGEAPTDRWHSLERADADVQQQADRADHHHGRDHQVLAGFRL